MSRSGPLACMRCKLIARSRPDRPSMMHWCADKHVRAPRGTSGRAATGLLFAIASLAVVAALVLLLRSQSDTSPKVAGGSAKPLLLFCAAGLKPAVETVARQYENT